MKHLITFYLGIALLFCSTISVSGQNGEGTFSDLSQTASYINFATDFQEIFAFAKQGETITFEYRHFLLNNFHGKVTWYAPDGSTGTFPTFNQASGLQTQTVSVNTAAKAGVWKFKVERDLAAYPNQVVGSVSGDVGRFKWDMGVKSAGVLKTGRVYVETLLLNNGPAASSNGYSGLIVDDFLYPMAQTGHVFKFELIKYAGYYSTISFDKTGLNFGDCVPLYASQSQSSAAEVGNCGGLYRMYFNSPDSAMPVSAKFWDGSTMWLNPVLQEVTINHTDYYLNQQCTGTYEDAYFEVGLLGTAGFQYDGNITVRIDVENDGVFDGPNDRTIQYPYPTAGTYYIPWDGKDNNGAVVTQTPINAQITASSAIAKLVLGDIEGLGGINVYDNATGQPVKIYWDDRNVTASANQTPIIDGTAGILSGAAGGIHGWPFVSSGSWGDSNWIENWVLLGGSPTPVSIELNTCFDPCSPTLSGSLDTDGDGVTNKCDFDDDNDGVLDIVETKCAVGTQIVKTTGTTGALTSNFYATDVSLGSTITTFPNGGGVPTSPIYFDGSTGYGASVINDNPAGVTGATTTIYFAQPVMVYDFEVYNVASTYASNYFEDQLIQFYNGTTLVEFVPEIVGSTGGAVYGAKYHPGLTEARGGDTNLGDQATFKFTIGGLINKIVIKQAPNANHDDIGFRLDKVCIDLDEDTDMVASRLDLDSDGDECPDSKEAGVIDYIDDNSLNVTYSTVAGNGTNGIPTGTSIDAALIDITNGGDTVGPNNGFDDGLETGAAGVYDGTYDLLMIYDSTQNNCICYRDPGTGAIVNTKVGISTLNRSVNQDVTHWPENVNSAYLALESKDKGFVVPRMTTTQINAIASPKEGMVVYDTTLNCLKLYDATAAGTAGWTCLTQRCTNN